MTTIVIEANEGQITVSVDGQEPQPVPDAEGACQIIEATLGQPDADEAGDGELPTTDGMEGDQFAAGFQQGRGGPLNG